MSSVKAKYLGFANRLLTWTVLLCSILLPLPGGAGSYADRPQVQQFIDYMAQKHHFDKEELRQLFQDIKPNQTILNTITKARKPLEWRDYRPIFVTDQRARQGVAFWKQHAAILTKAQQYYGVPPEIIVAIIGVETYYGLNTGQYQVLESLATLSFDYPPRATYFKSELEQFLLLHREIPIIGTYTLGSYDGGMGQPQFMPSSYRRFAIDSNDKGYSDLINNTDDAILSIAAYLKSFGWILGGPVAVSARVTDESIISRPLGKQAMRPLKQFVAAYIYPNGRFPLDLKAMLISVQGDHGLEYWLGFNNFQVIKHYNSRDLYVLAVDQLSQLIRGDYCRN